MENKKIQSQDKDKMIGESYKVGYKFAKEVFEAFPGLIKAITLFGSVAKLTASKNSDIDIIIIVDDTSVTPTRKFIDWYNLELAKIVRKNDPRIHVTTVTLTTFWENVLVGEPVAINVLRYGVPLIDTGYFKPLQMLLSAGRIRPSKEAIHNAMTRAPWHMTRANSRILTGVIDLYWVMIDSAHAALMAYGKVPPSPEHIEKFLDEVFVSKNLMNKKFLGYYREVWKTSKAIIHGEIIKGNGIDFDRYRQFAEIFMAHMKKLVEKA